MNVYVLFHETNTGETDESDGYVEGIYSTEEAAKAAEASVRDVAKDKGWAVWGDDEDDYWEHDWHIEVWMLDELPLLMRF